MRTGPETRAINHFLRNRGFAGLDEPGALMQQLGFCVADHDAFRSLLTRCEPVERRNMYEALKPHLRFEAKALDVYLAEAGAIAEAKQLPTTDDTGALTAFKRTDIESESYRLGKAIMDEIGKYKLVLTCKKCTRQEMFSGNRKIDAVATARGEGWTYDELNSTGFEICPTCPGARKLD